MLRLAAALALLLTLAGCVAYPSGYYGGYYGSGYYAAPAYVAPTVVVGGGYCCGWGYHHWGGWGWRRW